MAELTVEKIRRAKRLMQSARIPEPLYVWPEGEEKPIPYGEYERRLLDAELIKKLSDG